MAQSHELDRVASADNNKPSAVHHAANDMAQQADTKERAMSREEQELGFQPHPSKIVRLYSHPWTQILLISFICFCLPGVSLPLIITELNLFHMKY